METLSLERAGIMKRFFIISLSRENRSASSSKVYSLPFSIFIDSPAVVEAGSAYLRILAVSQMFSALESVTAGVFNGCGRTTPPAVTSILLTAARIPMAYWLVTFPALGMNGIWWSISLSSVLKGSVLAVWYYFFQRRLHSARAPFPRRS